MRFFLFFLCSIAFQVLGQKAEVEVIFHLKFNNEEVVLNKNYSSTNGDLVVFENIQFYVSDLAFFKGKKKVGGLKEKAILFDVSEANSNKIILKTKAYDRLTFNLGLDSSINVSGALGGDLDPTKGMYWTWQSGYIHFKMEGKIVRNDGTWKEFVYHLGGYQQPHAAIAYLEFEVEKCQEIEVAIALESIFNGSIDFKENQIMHPSLEAAEMMKILGGLIHLAQ